MARELGEIRQSQAVTTYAPGSIVDMRAQGADGAPVSVVMAGLDEWDQHASDTGSGQHSGLDHPQVISEPRLQKILGVDGFRLPPIVGKRPTGGYENGSRLVGYQFPTWLQCRKCHALKQVAHWTTSKPGSATLLCNNKSCDKEAAIPTRFVMACENGHLENFPWDRWVPHKADCKNRGSLRFEFRGAGLAGLFVTCPKCKASRHMEGCFSAKTFEHLGIRCQGHRPWLNERGRGCECTPRGIYRGASNVHFPILRSTIDIPPFSDSIQKRIPLLHWNKLLERPADRRAAYIEAVDLHVDLGMADELHEVIALVNDRIDQANAVDTDSILPDEWRAFKNGSGESDEEFETRAMPVPPSLSPFISRLLSVTKLREVRAFCGFTRINPPPSNWTPGQAGSEREQSDVKVADISIQRKNWLPGIEVKGEGLYLELNHETLEVWEQRPYWQDRAARLDAVYQKDWIQRHGENVPVDREITPRFLLIHAFAHALIRALSVESGYSGSSLRERLYARLEGPDMAGLLVYTATTDKDGTLGGLSRQAVASRFETLVIDAVRGLEWCSSDPLCSDDRMSMSEDLNLAACHSCMLISETSCVEFNLLLDRVVLVGTPNERSHGFFSGLLDHASDA